MINNNSYVLYCVFFANYYCSIICIDLILGEKIGIGTVLDAIVVGKTVDLLNYIGILGTEHSLPVSLLMLLIGFILEGFSQFLYMRVGLCRGPRDALQIALGRRVPKVPIGVVNIFLLAAALTVGFFLGGPIGIGTLIAPFGIGIFQQLVFNLVKFEPKDVEHQSIIASFMILFKKNN